MVTPSSFCLLDSPWISCTVAPGGDAELVSLRQVFDGSCPLLAVRGDSPTQDYAVLRLILAIYWRAHAIAAAEGGTGVRKWRRKSWSEATSGAPDEIVLDYLSECADRFDLLHPEAPFMQVCDLETTKGNRQEVRRIIFEAEGDYFTTRSHEGRSHLSLAEAARWLVHIHAYDYSGIKSGAIGDARVKGGKGYPIGTGWAGSTGGTVVLGANLRQTLVLNTAPLVFARVEDDLPVWERPPDSAAQRPHPTPTGPVDLATWQARRVRLFMDGGVVREVLVSNGDQIPDAGANVLDDPMTPYRFSRNKSKRDRDVYFARPYDVQRTMWRSLEPLLALEGDLPVPKGEKPSRRPANLDALAELSEDGIDLSMVDLRLISTEYGPQQSSAGPTIDARIGFPRALLSTENSVTRRYALTSARATVDAAISLGRFAGRLLQAAGGEYAFRPSPTDGLLSRLEPGFQEYLRDLAVADAERASAAWQRTVRDAVLVDARELLQGAGPRALIGRTIVINGQEKETSAALIFDQLKNDLRRDLRLIDPAQHTQKEPHHGS